MPRPDPAVATTADRLAARLPHLSPLQLAQVAEDIVQGVDEARDIAVELDEVHREQLDAAYGALQAAHRAAQQRIADLEGRGLAGTKVGPYVLVPADLLQELARSREHSDEELVDLMGQLVALVYNEDAQ